MICTTLFYKTHKDTGCQLKSCWHDRNSIELIRNSRYEKRQRLYNGIQCVNEIFGDRYSFQDKLKALKKMDRLCQEELQANGKGNNKTYTALYDVYQLMETKLRTMLDALLKDILENKPENKDQLTVIFNFLDKLQSSDLILLTQKPDLLAFFNSKISCTNGNFGRMFQLFHQRIKSIDAILMPDSPSFISNHEELRQDRKQLEGVFEQYHACPEGYLRYKSGEGVEYIPITKAGDRARDIQWAIQDKKNDGLIVSKAYMDALELIKPDIQAEMVKQNERGRKFTRAELDTFYKNKQCLNSSFPPSPFEQSQTGGLIVELDEKQVIQNIAIEARPPSLEKDSPKSPKHVGSGATAGVSLVQYLYSTIQNRRGCIAGYKQLHLANASEFQANPSNGADDFGQEANHHKAILIIKHRNRDKYNDEKSGIKREVEKTYGFILDAIPGCSLEHSIKEKSLPQDMQSLLFIAKNMVDAVAGFHAQGKLHRDIKPANLMRRPDGRIVLIDLGGVIECKSNQSVSDPNRVGTPVYMADELSLFQKGKSYVYSQRTDIFSLGISICEVLGITILRQKEVFGHLDRDDQQNPKLQFPMNFPDSLKEPMKRLMNSMLNVTADARPESSNISKALQSMEQLLSPSPSPELKM